MTEPRCDAPLVDMAFLTAMEGSVSYGYVPTHRSGASKGQAIGRSGVTIGIGCDLGGRSEDDLLRLGLPATLVGKLKPYLGKRRREAQQALAARPLQLSQAEAAVLSAAIAGEIFERLAARYDAATEGLPGARRFAQLPWQARTVIGSVAYQYGDNLPRATPRFWTVALTQDWPALVRALESFGDAYTPRRRREAELLRSMLAEDGACAAGTAPSPPQS
ncbi:MAG: pesticin C-terminus-like muramidase [Rhodospirillales bacterium]